MHLHCDLCINIKYLTLWKIKYVNIWIPALGSIGHYVQLQGVEFYIHQIYSRLKYLTIINNNDDNNTDDGYYYYN